MLLSAGTPTQATPANPDESVIPSKEIIFEAKPNGGMPPSFTNSGNNYAKFDSSNLTFSVSEEDTLEKTPIPKDSTIVFRTHIDNARNGYYWYQGLDGVEMNGSDDTWKTPKHISINTPTSKIVLESIDPKATISAGSPGTKKSPAFGEGGGSDMTIIAKELHIGSGKYQHKDLFSFMSVEESTENAPAQFFAMNDMNGKASEIKVKAHTVVHTDGIFGVVSQKGDYSFALDGDLSVLGGGVGVASMGEGKTPDFRVNGNVHFKDAKILTFIPQSGTIKPWKLLSASGNIKLEGTQSVTGMLALMLQDFVDIAPDHKDYGWALQIKSEIYAYSVEKLGSEIYIAPKLNENAKKENIVKLINDGKNQLALNYYRFYKKNPDKDQAVTQALSDYLKKQGINPDTRDLITLSTYSQDSSSHLFSALKQEASSLAVSQASGVSSISTSGFDSIDAKLALIQSGLNNALAENIKNSKNDLLAVNFVNTLSQPFNNTPITLLDEVKNNLLSSSQVGAIFYEIQNNLGARLSVAQRLSSYSFADRASTLNSEVSSPQVSTQTSDQDSSSSQASSPKPSIQDNLWFNLLGGATLNASAVGGNFGFNLGYDKLFDHTILGAYLSYAYLDSKDFSLQANTHSLEAGLYLRSDFSSNQIDFTLRSLFASSTFAKTTQALESKTDSNLLNSFTQASLSYGYNIVSGSFETKPYLGVNASFAYTPSYQEKGDIPAKFNAQSNFTLGASLGLEFKKYFSANSFFYIIPSIEQTFLNTQKELKFSLSNLATQTLNLDQSFKTYAQVLLGGEISLSSSWNLNLSLGVKQSIIGNKDANGQNKNQTMLVGSIGGVWKF